MREEALKLLKSGPSTLLRGAEYFIVYSPDDSKNYLHHVNSEGGPFQMLEMHSHDEERVLATVFSHTLGKRFMIVFEFADVRPV